MARPVVLPQAPVFRPTAEEFADPLKYIASIRAQAEPSGIAKIIPPEGWAPPFAINKQAFRFTTKIQAIHELQDRLGLQARQEFHEDLQRCMSQEGKAFKKPPVFASKEVDLYKMYKAVSKRGGYAVVTEDKRWKDIVRILQVCMGMYGLFSALWLAVDTCMLTSGACCVCCCCSCQLATTTPPTA